MRDPQLAVEWALRVLGAERLVSARGLRDGGSPWLLHYEASGGGSSAVLRVSEPVPGRAGQPRREVRGIGLAAAGGVPVAKVLGMHTDDHAVLVLTEYVDGTSVQPLQADPERFAVLGATAARISGIEPDSGALPAVTHPIPGVDFEQLRAQSRPQPLLETAQQRVAALALDDPIGLVHGDLWSGNTLWRDAELAAVIDWDCAGIGPAGVDLGSLRCDAAMCYGLDAADQVLAGWEREAGGPAVSVAYWDVVAALFTPPEIGWFAEAISGMTARPDLTVEVLRERRDSFLTEALDRLG